MSIFQKIKDQFSSSATAPEKISYKQLKNHAYFKLFEAIFNETIQINKYNVYTHRKSYSESETYQSIKQRSSEEKIEIITYLNYIIHAESKASSTYNHTSLDQWIRVIASEVLQLLLKQKIAFSFQQLWDYLLFYKAHHVHSIFYPWPVHHVLIQIEKMAKQELLTSHDVAQIESLLNWPDLKHKHEESKKAKKRIDNILFLTNPEQSIKPFSFSKEDQFGVLANSHLKELENDTLEPLYQLLELCSKATQSKPTKKFLTESKALVDQISIKQFKRTTQPWFDFVYHMKEEEKTHFYEHQNYTYTYYTFLDGENATTLKGLVWVYAHFFDSQSLGLIARLAERCYKKIPGIGPASASIGNACIYTLALSKGQEGVAHLSRLKLVISQTNTKNLIGKYIQELSEKLGITPEEIEDLANPDFDLIKGAKTIEFKEYKLSLQLLGIGKVQQQWVKPDGKMQKTAPSFIKESKALSDKLKKVKAEVKLIGKTLTTSRDRIDRSFLSNRKMTYAHFEQHYLHHGLMYFLTKDILWQFESATNKTTGRYSNEMWLDINDKEIDWMDENTSVTIWHPVFDTIETIVTWREKLMALEILQPIKQIYREVYLLTDAEINTRMYSNRMAAHIIKQHQFNALTSIRDWKYQLLMAYDTGMAGEIAEKNIPAYNMKAEFWIVEMVSDDAYTDSGVWSYVSTDQVRFVDEKGHPIELIKIPKVVLSEILRDVDMFVGVCSVGNDPQWMDNGGHMQHRDYWQSYSFGELSEIAKTRKEILEKILPKLNIGKVSRIEGKFLIVEGKLRTYKIHIGSTNILMEPNDQYLCIVPSGKRDNKTSQVFLPFDGDKGLSIILSKAFLLADDDKITDSTITSQINGY